MYKRNILAISISSVIALWHQSAMADSGKTLEVIEVTATKRPASQQDVPIAVTGLTANLLEQRGITESSDLSGSAPSLTVSSPTGRSQPNFSVRGIGVGNEFNANAASPVGFYVNEDYKQFRASHGAQLFDLDMIEIIRGPQGTLFGRNTTGGAISIRTQTPELDGADGLTGYVGGSYGNFNRYRFNAAVESAIIDDVLAFRLAGTYGKGDGYVEDLGELSNGNDWGAIDDYAVRATVVWQPSDDFNATLIYASAKDKPYGAITVNSTFTADGTIAIPAFGASFPGAASYGIGELQALPNDHGKFVTKNDDVTLTLNWDLADDWSMTSITGYADGSRVALTDSDSTPITIATAHYKADYDQFNQDIRLAWTGEKAAAIIGLYYGEDSLQDDTSNTLLLGAIAPTTDFLQERTSKAIYFEGNYFATDDLTLTFGLRYTEDDFNLDINANIVGSTFFLQNAINPARCNDPANFTTLVPGPMGVMSCNTIAQQTVKGDSGEFTGRFIVDYKLSDDVKVYGSYSRGYRAGSFNGFATQSADQLTFVKPEFINAYEIGYKSQFLDNRAQFNAAVYHNIYTDQQVQEVLGVTSFLRNASGEMTGVELEFQLQATDDLYVSASLGLMRSEFDDGQIFAGSGLPGTGQIDIGGNSFGYAPEITANLFASWVLAETDYGYLTWSGTARYQDDVWYDPFNDDKAKQYPEFDSSFSQPSSSIDSYWLLDSRLELKSDKYSVGLWVKNLADEEYVSYGLDSSSFGFSFEVPGEPRMFGIDFKYEFY